jgi:hypothetical protein
MLNISTIRDEVLLVQIQLLFLELTHGLQVFAACLLVQDRLLGTTSGRNHRWNLARFY